MTTATNGHSKVKIHTSIGLKPETRQKMILMLNQNLADLFDLMSQTKQAHWNVKGPHFHALHLLFDTFAEGLESYVDTVAERVTALGGYANGSARMAATNSRIKELPTDILAGKDMLQALVERYAAVGNGVREGIDTSDKAGDAATADMLTDIQRDLDQWLWFMEAHLQEQN